jgi:hypothetical protein
LCGKNGLIQQNKKESSNKQDARGTKYEHTQDMISLFHTEFHSIFGGAPTRRSIRAGWSREETALSNDVAPYEEAAAGSTQEASSRRRQPYREAFCHPPGQAGK